MRKRVSRGKKPARKTKAAVATNIGPAVEYEHSLLRSIISGKTSMNSSQGSLVLSSVLSTLTPGMQNLYYKSGMSLGRALYKLYERNRKYIMYGESVADLVSFFENAGFSRITYHVFPDMVEITFHGLPRVSLGMKSHIFESGIISGFLTAAKRQHVKVSEESCINYGSDSCRFVTTDTTPLYLDTDANAALARFAGAVGSAAAKLSSGKNSFSDEYSVLSSLSFLENEYSDHMRKIVSHLGKRIGGELGLKLDRKSMRRMEMVCSMLGLGELKVKSARPFSAAIALKQPKAKKEFAGISTAFVSGLLESQGGNPRNIGATVRRSGKGYLVEIKELK